MSFNRMQQVDIDAETLGSRFFLCSGTSDTYPTAAVGGATTVQGSSDLDANTRIVVDRYVVRESDASGGVLTIKNHAGTTLRSVTIQGSGVGLGKNPASFPLNLEARGGLRAAVSNVNLKVFVLYRVLDRGNA